MLKKFISLFIVFPLFIVPLVCCCVKPAQAGATVGHCDDSNEHGSTDHKEHSGKTHSHASCDCHSFSTAAENVSAIQIISSASDQFASLETTEPRFVAAFKGSLHLAYLGPPGSVATVPLYTLYHSLRI